MIGESPTRPQRLPVMPPVDVAAATLPLRVERHRADGAERDQVVFLLRRSAEQAMQLRLPHRRAEVFVGDQLHALQAREFLRALAHQHHVRRVVHDQARERDRVLHVFEARDGACAQRACRP